MKNAGLLCIAMLFLYGTLYADRTIWYVHPDSILNTIQAGLDSCVDNDIVLVGPGTYYENILWPNTQGIHLVSELGSETTIIDGDNNGSVITCSSGIDTTTLIRGFTIQHGANGYGGGIFLTMLSCPSMDSLAITRNSAAIGGGIFCGGSGPIITNATIMGNWSLAGGGIALDDGASAVLNNVDIIACTTQYTMITSGLGAGIGCDSSTLILNNVRISHNVANTPMNHGGGISISRSTVIMDTCTITHNSRGGILCHVSFSPSYIEIHNSDIFSNGSGVNNLMSTLLVEAGNNWWGDATGPYHTTANPGGLGDTVSDYVDFDPWLAWPIGVEEQHVVRPVETIRNVVTTIFRGPLQLPEGKKCKVFDITGRVVEPGRIRPGIYFIEIDGVVTQKVVKVR